MTALAALDGVLILDKPVGPTSHDVVARARRALGTPKVGHTGTLDPLASGVLPLVVGRATRLARFLSSSVKEYEATVAFGRTTDTCDAAGATTSESPERPSAADVDAAVARFRGTFAQTPPAFSAKKVGGERAYRLARQSTPVSPAPVTVTVEALDVLECGPDAVRLRVRASAGFYVRSLAHDLGAVLGCGAHLAALRRTRAGAFTLADAVSFDQLTPEHREDLAGGLLPLERMLPDLPVARLTDAGLVRVGHGRDAGPADLEGPLPAGQGPVQLVAPDGRLVAVAEPVSGGALHPSVVLR